MVSATRHPWQLVGPWYRWTDEGVPITRAAGRESRPVFQKYASTDFVNEFLSEPQRSLKYRDEDFVHRVVPGAASKYSLSKNRSAYEKTSLRKVFLDAHFRFYLVVCELHCDAAGFPSVARDAVCEAGFVVRRRRAEMDGEVAAEVEGALRKVARSRARIERLDRAPSPVRTTTEASSAGPVAMVKETLAGVRGRRRVRIEAQLVQETAELKSLLHKHDVELRLEGWKPGPHRGIGAWEQVESEPQDLDGEQFFPLYPLIPDPSDPDHSGGRHTLFFGVLPTSSSDLDGEGGARFDDRHPYEVRCFVRRHKETCPKRATPGDCPGELVWSGRTEYYQLASQFDLDGTSNHPVTIQLPDLDALQAQASQAPFGQGVGVRMVSPPDSSLEFKTDKDDIGNPPSSSVGGVSICFFAIPLITIVANFVLRLFLPIVVFVFGLWFLLRLKFCILPTFSMDAELAVQLDADLSIGVEADLNVSLDVDLGGVNGITRLVQSLDASLGQDVREKLEEEYLLNPDDPSQGADYNVLGKLAYDLSTDFSSEIPEDLRGAFEEPDPPIAEELKKDRSRLIDRLEYFERREYKVT